MYIVMEKESKKVILTRDIEKNSELGENDIHAEFDPKTMEMGWTELTYPPEHFKLDEKGEIAELTLEESVEKGIVTLTETQKIENNQIVEKSLEEQVRQGILELQPDTKIENDVIVPKTLEEMVRDGIVALDEPFEYISGGSIKTRSLQEAVHQDHIKTADHAKKVLRTIGIEINRKISKKYRSGDELKLLKGLVEWMYEDRPNDDERERRYLEMKTFIDGIKAEYKPLRKKVKQLAEKLGTKEA